MMLSKIKKQLEEYVGQKKKFQFNGSRNLVEEFDGQILALYSNIFVIKLETGSVRSYSYNDLLVGTLSILD
ncbi:MAG: Veg family protein [Mycoplasmatota bacterium]|nr:Veg family protein [Mycoplasmatota bacterium]